MLFPTFFCTVPVRFQLRNATSQTDPAADEESAPKGKVAAWSTLALLEMLILFGGAWQLMKHGVVSPLGLVLGYASLPIGITLAQMLGRLRP